MKYISVKELAAYLKLSQMMIYKLAQAGRVPAKKVGRVWRFDRDVIDGWMQGTQHKGDDGPVKKIVDHFVERLKKEYGTRLRRVVLFGSQARGDARDNSDIDLLVVLDRLTPSDRSLVSKIAHEVTYGRDLVWHLSTVLLGEKEFLTGTSPLLINVRKEGKIAA